MEGVRLGNEISWISFLKLVKCEIAKSEIPTQEEAQKNTVLIEICVALQLPSISQQWSKENPGNRVFFIIIAVSLFLSCSLVSLELLLGVSTPIL